MAHMKITITLVKFSPISKGNETDVKNNPNNRKTYFTVTNILMDTWAHFITNSSSACPLGKTVTWEHIQVDEK